MAVGNTFGATALSSYGGFWLSFGIILNPSFNIVTALGGGKADAFLDSMGFFLIGWWIFTTIMLACTLRSTVMFFMLFFWLDMAFLLLGIGYLQHSGGAPMVSCIKAGGYCGLLAAFLAWYNAFAGIADSSNRYVLQKIKSGTDSPSFITIPVMHFPWSDKAREQQKQANGVDKQV